MRMTKDEKVVMYDSDEAATYRTGFAGWVSRSGRYWGQDEHMARYDGSTHHACPKCGATTERGYINCRGCQDAARAEVYNAMPRQEWDGETPLVLFDTETYFWDEDDVTDYCDEEDCKPEDLQLVLCIPVYASLIDVDHWSDDLAEEVPEWLEDAVDVFNATIKAKNEPLSWIQGKIAVTVL